MFETANEKMCPQCHHRMRFWNELTSDEKFTVERLPLSAEFPLAERKHHLFCPRCWFETKSLLTTA